MSDLKAGQFGNLLFAVLAFSLGAWLVIAGDTGTKNAIGAAFAILGVVLGAPGGSSAFQQVKGLFPMLAQKHQSSSEDDFDDSEDSDADGLSLRDSIPPEDVNGADQLDSTQKEVLGFSKEPPALTKVSTELIRDMLFEATVPTYILNQDYHILDWNPAFEVAFGTHCRKLRRQHHVSQLIHYLDDSAEIIRHAAEVFGGDTEPLVDFEVLTYSSPTYGRMEFGKITSRATHPETGETIGWNVVLNVQSVEKRAEYETDLRRELTEQVNWRVYATSYDHVLLKFSEYRKLLKRHVDAVGARKKVLDLGAGTGNVALELLKAGKEVMAVDYNEAMLTRLREKCGEYRMSGMLTVFKQNLDSIRISKVDRESFDGAIMQNVLYALKNPARCLRRVHDALRPNGILVVSGPKMGTSLDALFTAIRNELSDEPEWDESLAEDFQNVLERNQALEGQGVLHQWTISDVRTLLEEAGFKVIEQDNEAYAGQAMLLVAQRVTETVSR